MTKLIPAVIYENTKKAIETYEEVFKAKLIRHEPANPQMGGGMGLPPDFDYKNSTMHAEIEIYGEMLYLSDDFRGVLKAGSSQRIMLMIEFDSKEPIDEIYTIAKKKGWKIPFEVQTTFWGAYMTHIIDPFDIFWQLVLQPKGNQSPGKKSTHKKSTTNKTSHKK